jgi:hypothetical protein
MAEMMVPRPPDRDATPATPTGIPVNQPMVPEATGDTGADFGHTAAHAGSDVMRSAKEQGLQVASEAGEQARGLYDRAVGEVAEQAGLQQKRIANGLYVLSAEAGRMAAAVGESGTMTPLAQEASDRFRQAGEWLERREPGDVVREVKEFARQHPGTFLIGAAVLGTVAGRLTKNLADGDPHGSPSSVSSPTDPTVELPTGIAADRRPL